MCDVTLTRGIFISSADMRGAGAVLRLLYLLTGTVLPLPGFGQEVSTNQSADFGTVSPVVASTVPRDSASPAWEVTGGGEDNETVAVTAPPTSDVTSAFAAPESRIGTFAVTEGPQESNNGSGGATGPILTQPPPNTPTEDTSRAPSSLTESPRPPGSPSAQTGNDTETPPDSAQHDVTTTAPHDDRTPATNPPAATAVTSPATQTAAMPRTSRPEEEEGDSSLLEAGGHKDTPDLHSGSGSNPLFVMIVSVFTVMVVMVVVVVGFHRYKKRNRRTDFRRLQDLPMDDMMEDTPLALYSY